MYLDHICLMGMTLQFFQNIIIHLCLLVGFAHQQLYSRFIYFPNMEQNDFYRKINELGNGIGSRKARGTNECNFFWSLRESKFGTKDPNEYSLVYLSLFPIFQRIFLHLGLKHFFWQSLRWIKNPFVNNFKK